MKYFYFIMLFILFFASLNIHAAPLKVVIDPGHGGTDSGAVGNLRSGKMKEADITLEISKKVFNLLKNDLEFQAVMTRTKDDITPLSERSKIAKKNHVRSFH